MIKKSIIIGIIVIMTAFLLVGCVEYKSFENQEDLDLIDEIAKIEQDLAQEPVEDTVVEEDVVLPKLDEVSTVSKEAIQISVKENELVRLNVKVTDPDKDPVTHTFSQPLNANGEWKTSYGDAGEYLITIAATDGIHTTEQKVNLVVERVNVAPIIEGVRDLAVQEGETVNFEPTVTDPNKDAVQVTVSEPLKDGTFKTDHTSAGEYAIKVTATDGELETVKSFKLVVNNVNVKPVIDNLENINVKEGELVEIMPKITDLDGDNVRVTISEPVGDDGVWKTDFTNHGEYQITILADDGKDKVSKQITVTVEDVNMPPEIVDISLQ